MCCIVFYYFFFIALLSVVVNLYLLLLYWHCFSKIAICHICKAVMANATRVVRAYVRACHALYNKPHNASGSVELTAVAWQSGNCCRWHRQLAVGKLRNFRLMKIYGLHKPNRWLANRGGRCPLATVVRAAAKATTCTGIPARCGGEQALHNIVDGHNEIRFALVTFGYWPLAVGLIVSLFCGSCGGLFYGFAVSVPWAQQWHLYLPIQSSVNALQQQQTIR